MTKLLMKAPKWAITILILVVSTSLFGFWWFTRNPDSKDDGTTQIETGLDGGNTTTESAKTEIASIELDPATMLIGGADLYQFQEGYIHLVRENWLEHEVASEDAVVHLDEEECLAVRRSNGRIDVYDLDGKATGKVSLSNGGIFDGYVGNRYEKAVFFKEGDIWTGKVDWKTVSIIEETQITSLGNFLGKPFTGRLAAATQNALLYRDTRLGLIHVNLATRETDSGQLPSNCITSPNGRLMVGDVAGNPHQLVVFDVENPQDIRTYPIPNRISHQGAVWLDDNRIGILTTNQFHVYDHGKQQLETVYSPSSNRSVLRIVSLPSRDGEFLMVLDSNAGLLCVNTQTKAAEPAAGPPGNAVEFLSDGAYLLSSDIANSEQRGTWLGKFGETEVRRIFAQPIVDQFQEFYKQTRFTHSLDDKSQLVRAFGSWWILDIENASVVEQQIAARSLKAIFSW